VRNEIETKRNEINENETKRNETKTTKTKRNETKSTLIQYDGRMQISKMGLILPYDKLSTLIIIIPHSREASGIQH
jgi:hypothetical protein